MGSSQLYHGKLQREVLTGLPCFLPHTGGTDGCVVTLRFWQQGENCWLLPIKLEI